MLCVHTLGMHSFINIIICVFAFFHLVFSFHMTKYCSTKLIALKVVLQGW